MSEPPPTTVICLHPASVDAYRIFNPNEWQRTATKGIVQSCGAELASLQYASDELVSACAAAKERCAPHFATIKQQWALAPWQAGRFAVFGQVPYVHVLIEAFFSGLKSLLDLAVQVLSTEGIVRTRVDGFHRAKDVYGGKLLNALERNAARGKQETAAAVRRLIVLHKQRWIDEAILARDNLLHPPQGAHQLMFELVLEPRDGTLEFVEAVPPRLDNQLIGPYTAKRLADVRELSTGLLQEIVGRRL